MHARPPSARRLALLATGVCLVAAPPALAQRLWTEKKGATFDEDRPVTYSDFKRTAKQLSPAVVHIQVRKVMPRHMAGYYRFFGGPGARPREEARGMGTGFIIHPSGLILTNNHVVEGADEVTVRLLDDREYPARVVGADPATDIALIRIDAKKLTVAPLGDSDRLEVGDWVMAIGNPFGLSHTVTTGIVSALGRRQVQPDRRLAYRDFIQTDASINPGNSGGPLINLAGEVVGMNSAIVGSASVGVGFAIPINMAKMLLPALEKHGKPQRSWLGVNIQPVTPELAGTLGLDRPHGALVSGVVPGGPAERAGLRAEDVIVEFNGEAIEHSDDLPWLASIAGVGKRVPVEVIRGGKERRFALDLEELPEGALSGRPVGPRVVPDGPGSASGMGIVVGKVPAQLARRYGLSPGVGVLVTEVDQGSPAMRAGLRKNDVVVQIQGRPVKGAKAFVKAVRAVPRGKAVALYVRRGPDRSVFVAIKKP